MDLEELKMMRNSVEGDLRNRNKRLKSNLRHLGEKMTRAAEALESREDDEYAINSLGEVQAMGSEIDRLCGERAILINELQRWTHLISRHLVIDLVKEERA